MARKTKSSPVWVCESGRYQDFELDFLYSIIHRVGDTDYVTGGLSSVFFEWRVFKDVESFVYFIAVLMRSKVLIPIHILPSFGGPSDIDILTLKRGELDLREEYLAIDDVSLLPMTTKAEDTGREFLAIFTSIREISQTPLVPERPDPLVVQQPKFTYLYIEFSHLYEWLKRHRKHINDVVFDLFGKGNKPAGMPLDYLIENVDRVQAFADEYTGKDFLHDLMMASLAKHAPKSRRKK